MNPKPDWIENAKKNAALEAVAHVKDGFVVGLGSGSTAAYAIQAIGARLKKENMHLLGVPTSFQAFLLAAENGIPITTLEEHPVIDVAIDGADQVNPKLELIKGMGGALTREKIVAKASKKNIVIADETKKVKTLGQENQPVPIEIVPFGASLVMRGIRDIGGKPVLRESHGKLGPVVTDNGNFIIDANFGLIPDPQQLEQKLKAITGVVETGLFIGTADLAYVGTKSKIETITK